MASNLIFAEDIRTGVVDKVPTHYLEHPTFGEFLREVRNAKTRVRLFEPAVDELDGHTEDELAEDTKAYEEFIEEAPIEASPATIKKGSK